MSNYSPQKKSNFWAYLVVALFICIIVILGVSKEKITEKTKQTLGCTKEEIQEAMVDLMKEKPELIIESVNEGQKAQQRKMIEEITKKVASSMKELEANSFNPTAGNDNGDITIYYFYDPNCGYCKMSNATVSKLLAEDKNIKVIYKPLPFLGKDSTDAIKVGIAVYLIDKTKYVEFHNKLMGAGRANAQTAEESAKSLGITTDQLNASLAKPETQSIIDQLMKISQDLGIRGVPAFVINGDYIPGALDLDSFKDKIKQQRAAKS